MNFLREFHQIFRRLANLGLSDNENVKISAEYEELCSYLREASEGEEIKWFTDVVVIQDPSLPIIFLMQCNYDVDDLNIDALYHLHEKRVIVFDKANFLSQNNARGKMFSLYFHLANPRYVDSIKKNMTNKQYYDALYAALEGIDKYIVSCQDLIRNNQAIGNFEWVEMIERIAVPQAIHVWKQALRYDDLITQFWNVPLRILEYVTTKRNRFDNATIQQFAKETLPSFERLVPDIAPLYRALSLAWLSDGQESS